MNKLGIIILRITITKNNIKLNNHILFCLQFSECLLDQKAPHYIDYETTGFPQHVDVVSQDMLPITKVQVTANAADFQHGDSSLILQQLTPPQSPPHFDAHQQQQQQHPQLVKQEPKVVSKKKAISIVCNNPNNTSIIHSCRMPRKLQQEQVLLQVRPTASTTGCRSMKSHAKPN